MKKKKIIPLAQNKLLGSILALVFFLAIGAFLYNAATNMNYLWKWNSIPKYFVYDETISIEAVGDGKIVLENDVLYIVYNDDSVERTEIPDGYDIDRAVGDHIYEYDVVASQTSTRAGPVINGLLTTLKISFLAAILTAIIGVLVAFMKLSPVAFLKNVASVYVAFVRGTPLLVQIFLFYFIVANLLELDRFTAGVISLGIFFGAYVAEVLRGAIQSIAKGQMEAANSLGISYFHTMVHIILPQAFKRALPTLVGEVIALVKDSSLVSVISITDLTKVGKEIVANTFSPFETWIVIALVYLSITFTMSYIGHRLEKRMAAKGGIN